MVLQCIQSCNKALCQIVGVSWESFRSHLAIRLWTLLLYLKAQLGLDPFHTNMTKVKFHKIYQAFLKEPDWKILKKP